MTCLRSMGHALKVWDMPQSLGCALKYGMCLKVWDVPQSMGCAIKVWDKMITLLLY